jgi:hypothetical protein
VNINYHYFTVKTLARFAGIEEAEAQYIAHFSQQVDDFIMSTPVAVKGNVPDFFKQNGLAKNITGNIWMFLPCPTGFELLSEVSHDYQRHAMVPFHFIPVEPLNTLENRSGFDRSLYRCLTAEDKKASLVNKLMETTVAKADLKNAKSIMELGMMLHTYADTYAHNSFSGFHGWENQSKIQQAEKAKKPALNELEIIAYTALPSIGHANAGHTPDVCDYMIALNLKKNEQSGLYPVITRDNSVFFTSCSANILGMLCKINKTEIPDDYKAKLRQITEAQVIKNELNAKETERNWKKMFPNIKYHYNKEDYFELQCKLELAYEKSIKSWGITQKNLRDVYSPEGNRDRGKGASVLSLEKVSSDFFDYNELAYRRVYAVTGEYASTGRTEQLKDMAILLENLKIF